MSKCLMCKKETKNNDRFCVECDLKRIAALNKDFKNIAGMVGVKYQVLKTYPKNNK